jgi:hypothetical protein
MESDLAARIDALERENERLRTRLDGLERKGRRGATPAGRFSRRRLLKAGALAAGSAGLLAAEAARPQSAEAANGDPVVLGSVANASSSPTGVAVNQAAGAHVYGLGVVDQSLSDFPVSASLAGHTKGTYEVAVLGYGEPLPSSFGYAANSGVLGLTDAGEGVHGAAGSGNGVVGESVSGAGVHAVSQSGAAVYASSDTSYALDAGSDSGTVVRARTFASTGSVLEATIENTGNQRSVVEAQTSGAGAALQGVTTGSGPAIRGTTTGAGAGVVGNAKTGPGVQGTSPNGAGVVGTSANGRGAVLYGKAAHLRLYPAPTSTHPTAGARGDVYVDSSGRLWYCKTGGSPGTWIQLA